MKRLKRTGLLLCLSLCCLRFLSASDTVSVTTTDLRQLKELLLTLRETNENAMSQSENLQKLLTASDKELSGLKLNLENLRREIALLKSISETQGEYLNKLLMNLEEADKISKRQSALLSVTLSRNKRLTVTLWVGIPAAAGLGVMAGWLISSR